MQYLRFISILILLGSCTSEFKNLSARENVNCEVDRFQPRFQSDLYSANVDVINKHLSGLLFIKLMPDSSIRAVFQSEMGLTYFDFEWTATGNFTARSVIKQMNKKAVITTLRRDFELLLMKGMDASMATRFSDGAFLYTKFPKENEYIYLVSDSTCSQFVRLESASSRKVKVTMTRTMPEGSHTPDSVFIQHRNFKFTITLKRIQR